MRFRNIAILLSLHIFLSRGMSAEESQVNQAKSQLEKMGLHFSEKVFLSEKVQSNPKAVHLFLAAGINPALGKGRSVSPMVRSLIINDETTCRAESGQWMGTANGNMLQMHGCRLPTRDAKNECYESDDCESVCLKDLTSTKGGRCFQWTHYKGCDVLIIKNGKRESECLD